MNIRLLVLFLLALSGLHAHGQSTCFGTVESGRIEGAVSLPMRGPNFVRMSQGPVSATRVYVHTTVHEVLLAAFAALELDRPRIHFTYGETGFRNGGPIPPHRTHQNGNSVDIFVPVTDERGETVPYPATEQTQFGYAVDFDSNAQYRSYRIDFPALGELIYQLDSAARNKGIGLGLVVFDLQYMPRLLATPRGEYLRKNVPFMKADAWVRHDDHIHVDFAVPCP